MPLRLLSPLLAALPLLAASTPVRAETPVIEWLVSDAPLVDSLPAPQPADPDTQLVEWLAQHMPQYRHQRMVGKLAGVLDVLRTRDMSCSPGLYRTPEREAYIAFTHPAFWVTQNHLIVPADRAASFEKYRGPAGALDLDALLRDPAFSGGIERDRSYTPAIDASLKHAGSDRLANAWTDSRSGFRMLRAGRLDWLIEYPDQAELAFRGEIGSFAFRAIPIAGAERPTPSYIGCSNTVAGRRVVADLDRALAEAGPHPPWQRTYESEMDAESRAALEAFADRPPG